MWGKLNCSVNQHIIIAVIKYRQGRVCGPGQHPVTCKVWKHILLLSHNYFHLVN